jgi:hypothetical protein
MGMAAALVVPLLLATYVLSAGPVVRVFGNDVKGRTGEVILWVYTPLILAMNHSENVRSFVEWYVKRWERR